MRLLNWIFSPISVALVTSPVGIIFMADFIRVLASPAGEVAKRFGGSLASYIMYICVGLVGLYLLFFMLRESRDWIRREIDDRTGV